MSHSYAARFATRLEASPVRRRASCGLLSTHTSDQALFNSSKGASGNVGDISHRCSLININSCKDSAPVSSCKNTLTVKAASPEVSCCLGKARLENSHRRLSLCETLFASTNGVREPGCSTQSKSKTSAYTRRKSFTATPSVKRLRRDSLTSVRIRKFPTVNTVLIHHGSSYGLLPSYEGFVAGQPTNSTSNYHGFAPSPCRHCSSQVPAISRRRSLGADVPSSFSPTLHSWEQQLSPTFVTDNRFIQSPKIRDSPVMEDLSIGSYGDSTMQEADSMRTSVFTNGNSLNLSPHRCSYMINADHLQWKMNLCAARRGSGTECQQHPMASSMQSTVGVDFPHTFHHHSQECLPPPAASEPLIQFSQSCAPSQSNAELIPQRIPLPTLQTVPGSPKQPVILVSDHSNLTLEQQEQCHSHSGHLSPNLSESHELKRQSCSFCGLYSQEDSYLSQCPYSPQNSNSPQNLPTQFGPQLLLDTHLQGSHSLHYPKLHHRGPQSQQRPHSSQGSQLHQDTQLSQRLQLSQSQYSEHGLLISHDLPPSQDVPLSPQSAEKTIVLPSASYYGRRSSCIPCFTDFGGKQRTENVDKELDSCSQNDGKANFDTRCETSLEEESSGPRKQCSSPTVSTLHPFSEYSLLGQGFSSWLRAKVSSSGMLDVQSQASSVQPKEISCIPSSLQPGFPGVAAQSPAELLSLPTFFDIDPLVSSGTNTQIIKNSTSTTAVLSCHNQSPPKSIHRSPLTSSSVHWQSSTPTHSQLTTQSRPQPFPTIEMQFLSQNSTTNHSRSKSTDQDFPSNDPLSIGSQPQSFSAHSQSTITHPQPSTAQPQSTAVIPQFASAHSQCTTYQESIVTLSNSTATFPKPTITFTQSLTAHSQFSMTSEVSKCSQQQLGSINKNSASTCQQSTSIYQQSKATCQERCSIYPQSIATHQQSTNTDPQATPIHTQCSTAPFVQSVTPNFPRKTYSSSKDSSVVMPFPSVPITSRISSPSAGISPLQVTSPKFAPSSNVMMGLVGDTPRGRAFPHAGVFTSSPFGNTNLQSPFPRLLHHQQSFISNRGHLNQFSISALRASFDAQNSFKDEAVFQGSHILSGRESYHRPEVKWKNCARRATPEVNLSSSAVSGMKCPLHMRQNSFARHIEPSHSIKWNTSSTPGKLLGRGGFGVVRVGYFNERPVAVKTLRGPSATRSALRERRLLGLPSHPHLVAVLAVIMPTSTTTTVMNSVQAPTLHDFADSTAPILKRTMCHANAFESGEEEEAAHNFQVLITYADGDGIQQRMMSQSVLEATMGLSVDTSPFLEIHGHEDIWEEACQEKTDQSNEKEGRRFRKEGLRQEAGLGDPWAWVVTELCTSHTLLSVINSPNASYTTRDAIRWMGELCSGLAFLHRLGLVHRDVKPANALILASGCVKLGDFGCCVRLQADPMEEAAGEQGGDGRCHSSLLDEEEEDMLLDEECVLGTVPYQAPEVLRGQRGDDHSDVYSLGVTMWHLMTKETPFNGLHPHVVIYKVGSRMMFWDMNAHNPQSSKEVCAQWCIGVHGGGDTLLAALVHRLLLTCWTHPPDSRPSALRLCRILAALYLSPAT